MPSQFAELVQGCTRFRGQDHRVSSVFLFTPSFLQCQDAVLSMVAWLNLEHPENPATKSQEVKAKSGLYKAAPGLPGMVVLDPS